MRTTTQQFATWCQQQIRTNSNINCSNKLSFEQLKRKWRLIWSHEQQRSSHSSNQRTQQQQLKQQIFYMSCQLFYTTKRTKFEHTLSLTQEAAWQYFSRTQLLNYVFRKKHVNNSSWKEPTKQTQKLVTKRPQKSQIWKTTNATISNRYSLWKTSICQSWRSTREIFPGNMTT